MPRFDFDFGVCVLSEYDSDGHLGFAIDHCGVEGKAGGAPAADASTFAFRSRPLDPDKDSRGELAMGCGLLWWRNGDQLNAIPLDDPRVTALLPKLRKGGSMQYCGAGSYALFDGEDPAKKTRAGSYILSTKYGNKSHVLSMNVRKAGKEEVSLKHGEGHGLAMTSGGKRSAVLRNAKGNAYVETNDDGNVIVGRTKVQGSLSVGDPAAAGGVVMWAPFAEFATELIGVVAAINAVTTGAPAAALVGKLAALKTRFLLGT